MKKFLLGVMMAASIAGTAHASIKANQDMEMLFNAAPVTAQVEPLTTQEMKATEGEWIVWGARMGFGGLSSGVRYGTSYYGTSQYSAWGHARAVGYGAVGGLFGWNAWSSSILGAGFGAAGQRWGW